MKINDITETIRKLPNGQYRLYSSKGKNLGTFDSKKAAEKHEREVQYFKHNEESDYERNFDQSPFEPYTPTILELAKKYNVDPMTVFAEVKEGVKVESEHTTDFNMALEIALDHLNEKLNYYQEITKMEESATVGATSSANIAPIASVAATKAKTKRGKYGAPEAPQKKNKDGTVKNALDVNNNLLGTKVVKR